MQTAATPVADLELPALDYTDPTLKGERFHEVLRDLRDRTWVARAEPVGWFVLDREAVAHFMRTRSATFPGRKLLEVQGVTEGPLYERLKGNLLDLQGEDHKRLRKLVQPSFTPAAADERRPAMRGHLENLWDAVADDRRCDFVESFAQPFPTLMIAEIMGAPASDAPRLGAWANRIQQQFDPVKIANELPELERAAAEFVDYTRALMRDHEENPREDLITQLLPAGEEGVHLVSAILVGGVDTTQAQLAHAVRHFANNPDQWRKLGEDPELAVAATEEILRYEPITPFTARIMLEDVEYRDVLFPEGTLVFAVSASANRDPESWAAPDVLDIEAERDRSKPLTFGAGPHFCLGANLARAELQEALAFLSRRMPDLELDGEPEFDSPLGVYAVRSLPIRW
jgi:cytochrome P450